MADKNNDISGLVGCLGTLLSIVVIGIIISVFILGNTSTDPNHPILHRGTPLINNNPPPPPPKPYVPTGRTATTYGGAYDEGFDDGYEQGYEDAEGDHPYEYGYDDYSGFTDNRDEAYSLGYYEGYEAGYKDGQEKNERKRFRRDLGENDDDDNESDW